MKFVKKIYMEIKISFKKLYLICDIYICMGLKGLWRRGGGGLNMFWIFVYVCKVK